MTTSVKIGFVSLGCPKNTVDSEQMLGYLQQAGAQLTTDVRNADVIVVNTCGFIEPAKEESIDAILEASRLKSDGRCQRLVVAGCLVQRYRQQLAVEIPEIDAFVDLDGLQEIVAAVQTPQQTATRRLPVSAPPPSTSLYGAATPRRRTTPAWSAYLKIAEGCDNPCSFCAIPRFRGAFRSRALEDVVQEARQLAAEGVRELNLIAQDSTSYGLDRGLQDGPARLLRALDQVDGLRWVRLFYVYPNKIQDSLLEAMASCAKVARYIDIPLQHASRPVLSRMQRGGSADQHLRLLQRLRQSVPGVSVRTTMIVGFPGETEEDFQELCDFVTQARFDHLGAFTYSHEEGTDAVRLQDDVPEALKKERYNHLMALQTDIATTLSAARVGQTLTALCEGACPETEHLLQGRLEGQAPEVDGRVLINDGTASAGQFIQFQVTESHAFDLVGRALGPA